MTASPINDIDIRDGYTARGMTGLSSWDYSQHTFSQCQINLGSKVISKLQLMSILTINNYSYDYFWFHPDYIQTKDFYAPKLFSGKVNTLSTQWSYDSKTYSSWPEMLKIKLLAFYLLTVIYPIQF